MTRKQSGASGAKRKARGAYDHLRLEETVGFLLSDVTRTMTRTFSARIAAHGVGMGIFVFLRILWEEDGLTQNDLAARARMRGPSAAAALHELERRGFIWRKSDPHDRRKIRVILSAEGRKLYNVVMPVIETTNQAMLAGFSAGEQAALKRMLHRMRRNLAPEPAVAVPEKKRAAKMASPRYAARK